MQSLSYLFSQNNIEICLIYITNVQLLKSGFFCSFKTMNAVGELVSNYLVFTVFIFLKLGIIRSCKYYELIK